MPAVVTDYLLLLHERWQDLCKDFLQSQILTTTKSLYDKIMRNNNKMPLTKKLVLPACSNEELNNINTNQNVLGQLALC